MDYERRLKVKEFVRVNAEDLNHRQFSLYQLFYNHNLIPIWIEMIEDFKTEQQAHTS
jgi:hypothetical protein